MNAAAAAGAVGSWPGLVCLRPYAARSLMTTTSMAASPQTRTAYVRLFQTVCSMRHRPTRPCTPRCILAPPVSCSSYSTQGPSRRAQKKKRAAEGKTSSSAVGTVGSVAAATAADERSLVALRIQELDAAGARVYSRYEPQAERLSVPAFRSEFAAVAIANTNRPETRRVELSGRVLSVHRLGSKLFFIRLLDEGAQVQVMCNLRAVADAADTDGGSSLSAGAAFKAAARLLQRGDHVAVTGRAVRTSAQGELTLAADALPRVYAPALAPLPTRAAETSASGKPFHRSVALLVQPGAAATLRLRARLLQTLRAFLEQRRFVEVQTPIIAARAGGATARPFLTRAGSSSSSPSSAEGGGEASGRPELSLRIAPELWLKRLVVGGLDRVFEIGAAFRNEGIDATHNPEFTMCEFYAAYWTLPRLMAETEDLLAALARATQAFREGSGKGEENTTAVKGLPPADRLDVSAPFAQVAFVPGLEAALGFALPDLEAPDAYDRLREGLAEAGLSAGDEDAAVAAAAAEDDANGGGRLATLLDRLAGQHLESQSLVPGADGHLRPLFVTHHPACLSPLAKSFVCAQTGQRVAARAELFVGGRELANMYEEENDPAEQRRKMAAQQAAQEAAQQPAAAAGMTVSSVDEHYLAALETGLPPTGGWGCGVERLVMLFAGQRRIADCLSFGTLRHVVGMSRR